MEPCAETGRGCASVEAQSLASAVRSGGAPTSCPDGNSTSRPDAGAERAGRGHACFAACSARWCRTVPSASALAFAIERLGEDPDKLVEITNKLLMQQALTQEEEAFLRSTVYGKWGEHSAFGQVTLDHGDDVTLHWFTFGDLLPHRDHHPGKPTANQGSGTWLGPMIGVWTLSNTPTGSGMNGTAELVYDFALDELDLTLTITDHESVNSDEIRAHYDALPPEIREELEDLGGLGDEIHYRGPDTIKWEDVRQNSDGSFFISGNHERGIAPDPVLGILDGDFYGDAAQEVAGYFERTINIYDLRGVFGGKRLPNKR